MGTWIVGLIVLALAGAALRSIWKDKKAGKTCGSCSGCSGSCCDCKPRK
ncbi:MAG: FeoB-associated Cys-rich membrane protein [Lachnospiraceae bacterium]|nr:FeoB-associated Cys-rich membrane protein [Lachnospiraceae bacterium]